MENFMLQVIHNGVPAKMLKFQGLSEPVAIVNILLFALLASCIALRQGSLWMACGVHTG
jgi:membrane protease YdiL (CAAX protease family)